MSPAAPSAGAIMNSRQRLSDRRRGHLPRRHRHRRARRPRRRHPGETLFDRVKAEHGRLDILVNNAFALPDDLTDPQPFWDKPLSNWEMVDVGVRSNFVAARPAAQLMVPQGSGLDRGDVAAMSVSRTPTASSSGCARPPSIGWPVTWPSNYSPTRWPRYPCGKDSPYRTGPTESGSPARDDRLDRHHALHRLVAGVSRPGDRCAGHRPRPDGALWRHFHHR